MSTRPKSVTDFNPQSQSPGSYPENPLAQGARTGSVGGGSKASKPNLVGSGNLKSSAPKSLQKLRG